MRLITLIIFVLSVTPYFGQDSILKKSMPLIQFSGVVVSTDSLDQLGYTTALNLNTRKRAIADMYGYFSFVLRAGDTVEFSHYGYNSIRFVIPDTITKSYFSLIQALEPNATDLGQVEVYPWPSREQFAQAFLEMDLYDGALQRAQRQLSGESLAKLAESIANDASLAQSRTAAAARNSLSYRGQTQPQVDIIQVLQAMDSKNKRKAKKLR